MARWQIPGAAIAIVKDGQILISKGYGMTDLENGHPVNDETLFMIASNSKLSQEPHWLCCRMKANSI